MECSLFPMSEGKIYLFDKKWGHVCKSRFQPGSAILGCFTINPDLVTQTSKALGMNSSQSSQGSQEMKTSWNEMLREYMRTVNTRETLRTGSQMVSVIKQLLLEMNKKYLCLCSLISACSQLKLLSWELKYNDALWMNGQEWDWVLPSTMLTDQRTGNEFIPGSSEAA